MQELIRQLETLSGRIATAVNKLDLAADEQQIEQLTAQATAPDFWSDPQAAAVVSQRLAGLQKHVADWRGLQAEVRETLELARLAEAGDTVLLADLRAAHERAAAAFEAREFELKLSGPHDRANAILEIQAGAGGTDAQDWAAMLQRMYLRWAERQGFSAEVLSLSAGEEAGLKSTTIEISGPYAYGKLKGEAGTHRLVRLSPFNADNLRQTSFALVEVLPQLDQATELDIDPKDLRIDVYRSGGHGGQSVNTTDSAVRITHLPTGTVVAIQNERSQLQNKEKAMAILRARLTTLMEAQHKAELGDLRSSDQAAAWGQQIRNYVLHPYTKVKDVRTGAETSQAQDVLDGDLNLFIEAYLNNQIGSASH
ncbi:MAG TPA: peptide chain release factor 2 [Candidatus Saccharimonadia bacterium]|nr:peptide chain release factor 2 [Candidatus Saccharimonadia bacterium]